MSSSMVKDRQIGMDRVETDHHRHTTSNDNLLDWGKENALNFGLKTVQEQHKLCKHPLFSTENIIDLLENYPRDQLQAFTMGHDRCEHDDWTPVDTEGVSGEELFEAVTHGRLWFNILRLQNADNRYGELLDTLFGELTEVCPNFNPIRKTATLIISSPRAIVYYHADALPNLLWQISGSKRVWVYPPCDQRLVSQDCMEDIFAAFADEEVYYEEGFDKLAKTYDVNQGQILAWPLNSPHRVTNLDSVNISLSTPYETEESDRRKLTYCANRLFRRKYHLPLRSVNEEGVVPYLKRFAYRAWNRAGLVDTPPRRAYITKFKIDPKIEGRVSQLGHLVYASQLFTASVITTGFPGRRYSFLNSRNDKLLRRSTSV